MRITGGRAKGQRLAKVRWPDIRPTADMVRGSIFNILGQTLSGLLVLDLFAGTGSLGIESLSRGAKRGVFMDSSRRSLAIIQKNIDMCGFKEDSILVRAELPRPAETRWRGSRRTIDKTNRFIPLEDPRSLA
jgi:16S rRNA (guanine966-N2)-methyltransferase